MKAVGPILELKRLCVEYHQRRPLGWQATSVSAVQQVSFAIQPAMIVGVVGESGCGKSSLARAAIRLLEPAAGEILFDGQPVANDKSPAAGRFRREVQYVFQDPLASLSPRRTIRQTLQEPFDLYFPDRKADRRGKILEVLQAVELGEEVLGRFPHQLSGGQQQRVALARSLIAQPRLIIADEPTSSLDVSVQARIIQLLLNLRDERGIAMIVISHDLGVIRQLADHVAVMYLGELVEFAPADRLFNAPAHPYTRSLLNSLPLLDAARRPDDFEPTGEPPSALTRPAGCVFHTRCSQVMNSCRTIHPEETLLTGKSTDAETVPATHRVRCHLWKK